MKTNKHEYYDEISKGYDELHSEEQRRKIKKIIQNARVNKKAKILDIGAGTGILSEYFKNIVCVEPSQKMLEEGLKTRKFKAICAKAEDIKKLFKENEFDAVFSLTTAHHFKKEEEIIKEIQRITKNEAQIIFTLLKKAKNTEKLTKKLKETFKEEKQIEEQTDIIMIMKNKKQ